MVAPLSVAIVAQDEGRRLARCLESLGFADEILLVDGGSRDDTVQIAEAFGCRVLVHPWQGYSRQKQLAVDGCRNDWVLIMDADERLPASSAAAIQGLTLGSPPEAAAYRLQRKNFFHGRWIRRCGWWPDHVVRLVDRRRGAFNGRLVHEQWEARGRVADLGAAIEHHSFDSYSDLVQKMQVYSSLSAREMLRQKQKTHWWSAPGHGGWMFFKTYILQLGLLEGYDGFMIALLNAGGSFMKYAKFWELTHYGGRRGSSR